jgi:archaellum component FlaF (FlaF/FlaG flagellin family)
MNAKTKSWVITGVVLFLSSVVFLGILYLIANSGDDTPVANTNNIQTPSNPESNPTLDPDKPIINPNTLNASTQNNSVRTGNKGSWSLPGDR